MCFAIAVGIMFSLFILFYTMVCVSREKTKSKLINAESFVDV